MNYKSINIIQKVQNEGFLYYFIINFTTLGQELSTDYYKLMEITKSNEMHRWQTINNKLYFKIKEGIIWDICSETFLMNHHDDFKYNNQLFLEFFVNEISECIQFKNVQIFINITKDELKNFWIIDKNHQIVYIKFRNLCGEGAVKRTYLGWNITQDKPIVVYQINVSLNNTEQKRCLNEKRIAEIEKSPYLLTIHYSVANKETRKIYMIADYYKYDVRCMIMNNYEWSCNDLKKFSQNILNGLKVLHNMNIVHRDIKPSNIIYDDEKDIYLLIDFGVATKFTSGVQLNKIETLNGNCDANHLSLVGTPGYISPEMYNSLYSIKKIQYSHSVDIFSFGITLLEMCLKKRAFLDDFKLLFTTNIKKDLSIKEKEFEKILSNDSLYLQEINKKLNNQINTKKLETLRNEIQEKIDIINQFNVCDDNTDKEMYLNELIDKNKTIVHCCQKFSDKNLKELDNNTSLEYEFISKMKVLRIYAEKIDQNKFDSKMIDDMIDDFQNYPLLFMISSYEYPLPLYEINDPLLRDFLERCLHKNPEMRANTEELLNHPWLIG